MKGDLAASLNVLFGSLKLKINQDLKEKLETKLKHLALKCYILVNQRAFKSFSLVSLSRRFDLNTLKVRSEINKLVLAKLVAGRWNDDSLIIFESEVNDVIFSKSLNTLQSRIQSITENNISLLEFALKSSN